MKEPNEEILVATGRKHAKEAWFRGHRNLKLIPHDPDRQLLSDAHWHLYRGAYRGELHNLNLAQEASAKRVGQEVA